MSKKFKKISNIYFIFLIEKLENFVNFFIKFSEKIFLDEENSEKNYLQKKKIVKNFSDFFNEIFSTEKENKIILDFSYYEIFDLIYLLFDIFYELLINSNIFESIIQDKITSRAEILIMLSSLSKKTEKNNFSSDLINELPKNNISNNTRSSTSASNTFEKINIVYENLLDYDPQIFSDKNFVFSVKYFIKKIIDFTMRNSLPRYLREKYYFSN